MLEIIAIIFLCNVNAKNARTRGRKPGAFIALTLGLWIGLEFLGAALGQAADLELGAYGLAILFAIIGGTASYFITKNCKPGQEPIPEGSPATAAGPQPPAQATETHQAAPGTVLEKAPFCPQCGTPFLESASFCRNCGAPRPLSQAPSAPVGEAAKAAAANANANADANAMGARAETLPEDSKRAVTAGIVVAVGWLVLFIVQGLFQTSTQFNQSAGYMTASALLGIGAYLFTREDKQLVITGGIFGGLFAALYACSARIITILVFSSPGMYLAVPIGTLAADTLLRFFLMLVCAALTLGSFMLMRKMRSQENQDGSLYANAGIAAAVMLVFLIAYVLIRSAASGGAAPSVAFLSAIITGLSNAAMMFLGFVFADRLSKMDTAKLKLRGLGLAWAWIATCATGLTLIALVFMEVMHTGSLNYSSAVVLAVCGFVGYIMLICGKRQGLYVVVGGATLLLASQFFAALGSLPDAPSFARQEYISVAIASIVGGVNPLLAWVSVRYSSQPATGADDSFLSKEATPFDYVVAACNILMGAVLVVSMVIGSIFGTRIDPIVFVILLIGVLFAAYGITAIVLGRKKDGKFPPWLRITGIVMFALDVLVVVAVLIQVAFGVIR